MHCFAPIDAVQTRSIPVELKGSSALKPFVQGCGYLWTQVHSLRTEPLFDQTLTERYGRAHFCMCSAAGIIADKSFMYLDCSDKGIFSNQSLTCAPLL